jgi:chaperonin GroEL
MQSRRSNTRPAIVFQPRLVDGIDTLAALVRGTLGPLARAVAVENNSRGGTPEVLDDAGLLAQRVIQLADPVADAGAMLLRGALLRMRELHGDGAATTAVITHVLVREAVRALAAGAHPSPLRDAVQTLSGQALTLLRAEATPIGGGSAGRETLRAVAAAMCADSALRDALTEAVDVVGAEGEIKIVPNDGRAIDSEFVEGAVWDAGWQSAVYANEPGRKVGRIEDAAVIALSGGLTSPEAALDGLKTLVDAGCTRIFLVADACSDGVTQLFNQANQRGLATIVAARAPFVGAEGIEALEDIAALTGATVLSAGQAAADTAFARIDPAQLGAVRRAWVNDTRFGLIAGTRDAVVLRTRIAQLRRQIADEADAERLTRMRARLGRLIGGSALIRVGAVSAAYGNTRRDLAARTARALQGALVQGVVAGGGATLLRTAARLQPPGAARNAATLEQRWAHAMLTRALREPARVILDNAGVDPALILAALEQADADQVFDARRGAITAMRTAGVVDPLETLCDAVRIAVSTAVMAFTTDALVLRKSF